MGNCVEPWLFEINGSKLINNYIVDIRIIDRCSTLSCSAKCVMAVLSLFFSLLFRFQKVFDHAVKQEELFENVAKPVADR